MRPILSTYHYITIHAMVKIAATNIVSTIIYYIVTCTNHLLCVDESVAFLQSSECLIPVNSVDLFLIVNER
jgi:hypothetical protein